MFGPDMLEAAHILLFKVLVVINAIHEAFPEGSVALHSSRVCILSWAPERPSEIPILGLLYFDPPHPHPKKNPFYSIAFWWVFFLLL
jgi:hypothetical protein